MVIADPTRRRIIDALRGGPADVTTLIERLDLSQSLVSKHLGVSVWVVTVGLPGVPRSPGPVSPPVHGSPLNVQFSGTPGPFGWRSPASAASITWLTIRYRPYWPG